MVASADLPEQWEEEPERRKERQLPRDTTQADPASQVWCLGQEGLRISRKDDLGQMRA